MRITWFLRHRKLDGRLAEARRRMEDSASELALSRRRAVSRKETVVKPLRKRAEENQFADMLRNSLQVGYRNGD